MGRDLICDVAIGALAFGASALMTGVIAGTAHDGRMRTVHWDDYGAVMPTMMLAGGLAIGGVFLASVSPRIEPVVAAGAGLGAMAGLCAWGMGTPSDTRNGLVNDLESAAFRRDFEQRRPQLVPALVGGAVGATFAGAGAFSILRSGTRVASMRHYAGSGLAMAAAAACVALFCAAMGTNGYSGGETEVYAPDDDTPAGIAARYVKMWDADHDGTLAVEEIPEDQRSLATAALDRAGHTDASTVSLGELSAQVASFDANGDALLDLDEWTAFRTSILPPATT